MELTSLTVLVDILDAGNLSQAARNLKMTRANVSYHLHQLEKSVGVQLVRRTTRRVEPTEVGLRLYAHGRAIQNEMLAARETIATLGQGLQGRVGLSVPSGYGQMVMSDWLIDFKRLYPGIVLDVRFENRVDDLIRDEVDIAIRVMPEPPPTLVARDLGSVRYIACASRAYAEAQGPAANLRGAAGRAGDHLGRGGQAAAPAGLPRATSAPGSDAGADHHLRALSVSAPGHSGRAGRGLVPDYVVQDAVTSGEVLTTLTNGA